MCRKRKFCPYQREKLPIMAGVNSQNVDSAYNLQDLKTGGKGDGKVCVQDMTPPVFEALLSGPSGGGAE